MDTIFFITSKIAWALLSPSNLIIFLLVIATLMLLLNYVSFAKKIFVVLSIFSFSLMMYPISDWVIQPLESKFKQPSTFPNEISGIIVLGGGEDLKRTLSWQDKKLKSELGLAGDRYIATKFIANQYPETPIIYSGGSGSVRLQSGQNESTIAKELFNILDIPNPIIYESESRNTYENFRNTKLLLPQKKGRYILITSAFHMPRSVAVARKFSIDVIPFPVDYRSNSDDLRTIDFDLFDHLKSLEAGWKEWIGLSVYYLTGKTEIFIPESSSESSSNTL